VASFNARPLYPEERPRGTHWIGGWVGPGTGLDDRDKRKFLTLPGLDRRTLRRPAQLNYYSSLDKNCLGHIYVRIGILVTVLQ
jgi:hypothetical protein